MRKLAYIFGIALFLFGFATGNYISNVSYDPIDYPPQFFSPKDKRPVLYIDPVVDNRKFALEPSGSFGGFKLGRFEEDPTLIYSNDPLLAPVETTRTSKTSPFTLIDPCCSGETAEHEKDKGDVKKT